MSTADQHEPDINIVLANGERFTASLEGAVEAFSMLPEAIKAAGTKRARARSEIVDLSTYGLVEFSRKNTTSRLWARPGAFGCLPLGVPVLRFVPNNSAEGQFVPWDSPSEGRTSSERWQVCLSGLMDVPLYECAWDDVCALERFVDLLGEDYDVLQTQAALMNPDTVQKASDPARWTDAITFARRLLNTAATLPAITDEVINAITDKNTAVATIAVTDPDMCRYVAIPGMVRISRSGNAPLRDFDKEIAKHGLIALRGATGRSWFTTERYAVSRGYRARIGTAPFEEWRVIQPANVATNGWSALVGFLAGTNSGHVVDETPLTLDEWRILREG